MNYYERHIGDYLKDTAHLSLLEHGVYARLLDVYYTREGPIPESDAARLIGARTREERVALQMVIDEFFVRRDGLCCQTRCDREIARYADGEPEREVKKANEDNRLKRHREERSRLFKVITDAGQHAPWNIGMNELRDMVKRITATAPETPVPPLPATAPATPATATQTPDTRHQTPDTNPQYPETKDKGAGTREVIRAPDPDTEPPKPRTPAGEACQRMKAAGLQAVNPSHPKLVALLDAGITLDELADAATDAASKGKPFAYALATAEGRRRDAAVQPLPDKAAVTVPSRHDIDPELARRNAEAAAWKPPTAEVRALLAETAKRLKGATA